MASLTDLLDAERKCRRQRVPLYEWQAAALLGFPGDKADGLDGDWRFRCIVDADDDHRREFLTTRLSNLVNGAPGAADITAHVTSVLTLVPQAYSLVQPVRRASGMSLTEADLASCAVALTAGTSITTQLMRSSAALLAAASEVDRMPALTPDPAALLAGTGAPQASAAAPWKSWARFVAEKGFLCASLCAVVQMLASAIEGASGNTLSAPRVVCSLKRAHVVMTEVVYAMLDWERIAKVDVFAAVKQAASAATLQRVLGMPQVAPWGTLVSAFLTLWGRAVLLFHQAIHFPLDFSLEGDSSQIPMEAPSDASSSTRASNSRDRAERGDKVSTGATAAIVNGSGAGAASAVVHSATPNASKEKASVTRKLLSLVGFHTSSKGEGEASSGAAGISSTSTTTTTATAANTAALHDEHATSLSTTSQAKQPPSVPQFLPLAQRRIVSLASSLAGIFALRRRPHVKSALLLLLLDNSTRQGLRAWQNSKVTALAVDDDPRSRSSMQSWTLCYATDGSANAKDFCSTPEAALWFKRTVFPIAGCETAGTVWHEVAHPGRTLLIRRVPAYDDGRLHLSLVLELSQGHKIAEDLKQARLALDALAESWTKLVG